MYLENCINSILKQDYENIEIILVDDGSKDHSGSICDIYASHYSNIKVVHKVNEGLGMARNTGLHLVSGEYVTFVDGDDFISNRHISNLYNAIKKSNADVCYGGYMKQKGDSFNKQINPLSGKTLDRTNILHFLIPKMCGKLDYKQVDEIQMSVCMALYKTSLIFNNDILFHSERELISEDFVFNLDYLNCSSLVTMSDSCGYFYRDTADSLTKKYIPNRLEKQVFFTNYIIQRVTALGIYDECIQRIYSTFFQWVRNIVKREERYHKEIGFLTSINNIKSVCNDPFVIQALEIYDDSYLTRNAALLNKLIRNKQYFLIWLVSYIKDITKR